MEQMNFKVVFLNSNEKVIETRYIDALNHSDLDDKANTIAGKLLEYSPIIKWEASAVVRTGEITG
ncbi:hypothetical protein P4S95_27945 [Aneurinibacillus aneurinilyticus]|uniref:hypothetical protein n=1 Tax=Aneurinibacillus aneurinilyticus TaxID=1391 RepID=UPI002E216728|nr:hypothetical protein [Aneurinibacillus aneurinilyticus]